MKKKGEKLPSIEITGTSEAVFETREGRLVKVCAVCKTELDRASAMCPNQAAHDAA